MCLIFILIIIFITAIIIIVPQSFGREFWLVVTNSNCTYYCDGGGGRNLKAHSRPWRGDAQMGLGLSQGCPPFSLYAAKRMERNSGTEQNLS